MHSLRQDSPLFCFSERHTGWDFSLDAIALVYCLEISGHLLNKHLFPNGMNGRRTRNRLLEHRLMRYLERATGAALAILDMQLR